MHWLADGGMFLEQRGAETGRRKTRRGIKPRGAPANDNDVLHGGHSTRVQNFLPRVSQVPLKVIQNDRRISRTSSQNDWCLM